jgi:hypothetical protein
VPLREMARLESDEVLELPVREDLMLLTDGVRVPSLLDSRLNKGSSSGWICLVGTTGGGMREGRRGGVYLHPLPNYQLDIVTVQDQVENILMVMGESLFLLWSQFHHEETWRGLQSRKVSSLPFQWR